MTPRPFPSPEADQIESRRYAWLLAAILLLALALRVGAAAAFQGLDSPPDAGAQPDQIDYELLAFRLSTGAGYQLDLGQPTALRPPGTSWALLPPYLAFGRNYAAGRVWFALLSTASCLFIALFTARAFGRRAGLFAALWLALYPGHFYYPMHFLSEVPYAFWLAAACAAAMVALERRAPGWAATAGLALGMAALTRPQALLVVPIAFVLALITRARIWRLLAIAMLAFALTLAPWVVRNVTTFHKASLSSVGGCTFWGAHNETVLSDPELRGYWVEVTSLEDEEHPLTGGEFEIEAACWRYGIDFVRENASAMPGLVLAKFKNFLTPFERIPNRLAYWVFALSWILSAPLLLAGLVLAWRANRRATLVVLAPVLATVATVIVFYGSGRFRDSMAVVLAVPVGIALDALLRRISSRSGAR